MIYRTYFFRSTHWFIVTVLVSATLADVCQADEKTDDLTTLTVAQAKDIVAKHKGVLSFRNLPEVDLDVARVLAQYKGEVRLNGLKQLTPEVAETLSRQPKAANLFLNGLTEITPEVARALAVRNGGMLSLNGLTELSPEVARELANVYAKLALGGVRHLSVESARELAKHRSKLTLMGLPEISDEAGEALTALDRGVLLNGLTKLTSPVMVEVLLRKSDAFLSFRKVQTITDEVATVLLAHDRKRPMALDSLLALPEKNAAALRASDKVILPLHLREPGVVNGQGMKLAYIPAGKFGMGSHGNEAGREAQERRHEVELTRAFYLGTHQVTVGQFRKFVDDAKYRTEGERDGKGGWGVNETGSLEKDGRFIWSSPGFKQADDHPVVLISWNDAEAYCHWLSKKENRTYRLPTEAEWEYACRAGTRTAYSFGDDPGTLVAHGNVGGSEDGFRYTAPVGQFKSNRYGLYDVHGNVWEWCSDWYDPKGYAKGKEIDPSGPTSGEARVHRGGGWSSSATRARSAARIGRDPSTYRGSYLGFRVLLE
jgi:formylglycine-generating enzyme required for sulfatase activity